MLGIIIILKHLSGEKPRFIRHDFQTNGWTYELQNSNIVWNIIAGRMELLIIPCIPVPKQI
jgi:hypothetical protein